ncbi:MAG: hypothetical protein BWY53_00371 [Parcubacteria group bacterium ADurb.Bin326]|nr:MAG: hypothetical protein BWY53_00371 [Parcubacteria group bacterium ADurb.Bin326]
MEGIKKNWIIFSVLSVVVVITIIFLISARGSEDDWICKEGLWTKHGNPSSAMPNTPCPGAIACTLDARICPDGSAVGRQGPNCEFAPCPGDEATSTEPVGLANPASANCKDKGGNLVMWEGPIGQYGLCFFDDNRACEEWAMLRGDCPVGGVKTTGYDTEAQRYCAWSGGSTSAVPNAICKFKDGSQCNVEEFYNGKCQKGEKI